MKKFDLHIDKYGSSLRMKDGQFLIRTKDSRQQIPSSKVRTIVLSKSTIISGGAVKLALDNEIDISFIERDGMPYARVWNSKFGSITTIRRRQLEFSESPEGSQWIREVICEKIRNQMALVQQLAQEDKNAGPHLKKTHEKFSKYLLKLGETNTNDALDLANQMRGWEANASKLFFKSLSRSLPTEFRFEKRSKRPAKDPFNAMLNYCYGILYNKIEGMMIRAGLDPHIGVFHKDQHNRPVLVFDFIEMYRHWAEYPVTQSFRKGIIREEMFDVLPKSVKIKSPGKRVIIELLMGYLNERVTIKGQNHKRILHLKNRIQEFANQMKAFKRNESKTSGI